ncbi:MAG: two-component system LytT family sensor kinase [Flavobacteriales bacterium]|jgi:two-component system LytT family sensor kinase
MKPNLRTTSIYWACQIVGWGILVTGNIVNLVLQGYITSQIIFSLFGVFVFGIAISHVFRGLVKHWKWTELGVLQLFPRVITASISTSLVYTICEGSVNSFLPDTGESILTFSDWSFVIQTLNFSILFFVWSALYFTIHYFQYMRKSEIRNLELRALNTEIELNNLRNQLRPHFMFNSLNSIRALINDDPENAKEAVTTLSSILRNTLLLGRHERIPLHNELDLVQRYLRMEQIRFEERLNVNYAIPAELGDFPVPPLMLQTLAENAVKHGIARLTNGGLIEIIGARNGDKIELTIINDGQLTTSTNGTSTGLVNTKNRLSLLYGEEASFSIRESGNKVICKLTLPKLKLNESTDYR